MSSNDIIAWLVPTARGTPADKAANSPSNARRSTSSSSPPLLASSLTPAAPERALQLSFSDLPDQPGNFVLGTDPHCDVVLPPLPGIAPRHCALRFDAEARLVLDDFSAHGTAVWYDWESSGDQTIYSWVLSSGYSLGFPGSSVRRIVVDIQGVRFQVVVNDHSADWDAYKANVDAFCAQPPRLDGLAAAWDAAWDAASSVAPLFSEVSLVQRVFVKGLGPGTEAIGEVYLWNMARPWEPMVRAAA
ncbi:hypothetical protein TOPH_07762 [Tolypocladium ophioglossoides CBS 100239]|uniref:FHA domain-containing protein n=1 Tax=Tolypocladium ophioglossoides (strain CBS 100239) TaxID=1163406 RepID=A0A0L0N0T3_TOLOC|nr:hypothetical protein TOPH_07762 [Tolypocladium ophioglossoides CBS 100239]